MHQKEFWIIGKHAVCEAIKNKKRTVLNIAILEQNINQIEEITDQKYEVVGKKFFNKVCDNKEYHHQGYAAKIKSFEKRDLKITAKDISNIIILNDISDQRNIGSIIRNCLAFNVKDIVISSKFYKSDSLGLYIAAAGSLEQVNIYEVSNIANAIKVLKENNFWIVGFDQNAKVDLTNYSFNKKNALILGSEGFGIQPLIKSQCDDIVKIKISNELESLNVSNTSAIILYDLQKKNRPN